MWGNHYGNGGGFDATEQSGGLKVYSPRGQKRKRAQNLVPVVIGDILCASDVKGFTIEGHPVGMVEFVGIVKDVDVHPCKITYIIEDASGSISVVQWCDGEKAVKSGEVLSKDRYVKVIGVLRSSNFGVTHIMVFWISGVEGQGEVDAHKLGVVHARLKMRQLVEAQNSAFGDPNGIYMLSDSVAGFVPSSRYLGSRSSQSSARSSFSRSSFPNPKIESVYKMVQGCTLDEGLHRNELMEMLKGVMSKKDLDDALLYLSDEGYFYSVMDKDRFKTTEL